MKKVMMAFLLMAGLCFGLWHTVVLGQYSSFIPTWKVGDKWAVEIRPLSFGMPKRPGGTMVNRSKKKGKVNFKIVGRKSLEKTKCFIIKVTNTVMKKYEYRMYIRAKDFTLKRFVEIYKGSKETKSTIDNPSKPFIRQRLGILCPLDFPQFPNQNEDSTLKTTLGLSNKKLRQAVAFNKEKTKMRVEMRTKVNGKTLKSVQFWTQGYPWWSKAERHWGKKKWEEGKLISYKLVKRRAR